MRTIMAVMMLAPALAHAGSGEELTEHETPEVREPARPYWDTCRLVWQRSPSIVPRLEGPLYLPPGAIPSTPAPAPSSGGGGGGSGLSGLSGGGKGLGEALLVLAVVAVAVLPIIIYVVDDDADPLTLERFYCPEFSFSAMGGVQLPTRSGQQFFGLGFARVRADVGYLGAMAEAELAPQNGTLSGGFAAHFLLRPVPKKHLEGALAIGGRRAIGPGGTLDGVEIGLPHTYVFMRDGYRKLGLELFPRLMWSRAGLDAGADLNLVIPIADVLQLRAGAGVFSFAQSIQFSASAGLTAHL
jgi:hypothetical protein